MTDSFTPSTNPGPRNMKLMGYFRNIKTHFKGIFEIYMTFHTNALSISRAIPGYNS